MTPTHPKVKAAWPAWSEAQREAWTEGAGIREHDGLLPREEAEARALEDVQAGMRAVPPRAPQQGSMFGWRARA